MFHICGCIVCPTEYREFNTLESRTELAVFKFIAVSGVFKLRQTVKTQNSAHREFESWGVAPEVYERVQGCRITADRGWCFDRCRGAILRDQSELAASVAWGCLASAVTCVSRLGQEDSRRELDCRVGTKVGQQASVVPPITAELRQRDWIVNANRVHRIMREDNLLCLRDRKFILTAD